MNSRCSRLQSSANVSVTITIKRSELIADLRSLAYAEADKESDESHAKHLLMDLCEDGYVERVTRIFNLAAAELNEKMYPYTKKPLREETKSDSNYAEPNEYVFNLQVPTMMSESTVEYVTLLIHEYITARSMEDAMMRLYEQYAPKWHTTAENVVKNITATINKRCRVMRRRQSVF